MKYLKWKTSSTYTSPCMHMHKTDNYSFLLFWHIWYPILNLSLKKWFQILAIFSEGIKWHRSQWPTYGSPSSFFLFHDRKQELKFYIHDCIRFITQKDQRIEKEVLLSLKRKITSCDTKNVNTFLYWSLNGKESEE